MQVRLLTPDTMERVRECTFRYDVRQKRFVVEPTRQVTYRPFRDYHISAIDYDSSIDDSVDDESTDPDAIYEAFEDQLRVEVLIPQSPGASAEKHAGIGGEVDPTGTQCD